MGDAMWNIVGDSPTMRAVYGMVSSVARAPSNVLITGETGTGKELIARAVHDGSARAAGPFVAINCAAPTPTLLESELFGHEKASFAGAFAEKRGFFELASGGTLVLDKVSELPLTLQAKVLRAIEQREVYRVGGTRAIPIDARLIGATNRDLRVECDGGRFRKDLYFRLRVVEVVVPPLRQRREDIPLLIDHLIARHNRALSTSFKGIDQGVMQHLLAYEWPGNVRELENALERAMVVGKGEWIRIADLPPELRGDPDTVSNEDHLRTAMKGYERGHLRWVLSCVAGNREKAAERLGINPSTLYRKLASLGLTRETRAPRAHVRWQVERVS